MNNPDIFIQAINPFLSVTLITDIIFLGFILTISIFNQDKWSVLDKKSKSTILCVILYFLIFIVWEIKVTSIILLKKDNIDNGYLFLDFIDPLLSIILITNILMALNIAVALFDKDVWQDFPDLFQNIFKIILSVICIYFIVLIIWELVIASEIIFT
jgi:hypothetical protein